MTALETQYSALSLSRKILKNGDNSKWATVDRMAVSAIPKSQAFAWSADASTAVWMASRSVPNDATFSSDLLPDGMKSAWWWFDKPLPIPSGETLPDDLINSTEICALLVFLSQDGWVTIEYRMTPSHGPAPAAFSVRGLGATLADVETGPSYDFRTGFHVAAPKERSINVGRFVLASSAWLRQRIAVTSSGHIERHRRRQLTREHDAVLTDVKVVQLRRSESPQGQAPAQDSVEWSCRWIVNGHWRNQYHPSTGKHELKYILPYVKGPEDKPLRVQTQTVYSVTR